MDRIPPPRAGKEGSGVEGTDPSPPGAGPAPAPRPLAFAGEYCSLLSGCGHDLCCSAELHLLFLKMHPDVSAPYTMKSATS